jgi:hypothetical protein
MTCMIVLMIYVLFLLSLFTSHGMSARLWLSGPLPSQPAARDTFSLLAWVNNAECYSWPAVLQRVLLIRVCTLTALLHVKRIYTFDRTSSSRGNFGGNTIFYLCKILRLKSQYSEEDLIIMAMAMSIEEMKDELWGWIFFGVIQMDLMDDGSVLRRMTLFLASVPSRLL